MTQAVSETLHVTQSLIIAIQIQQFFMTATFNDLAFMHHTDLVCITDRRKTVGNNDRSTVTHQVFQCFLYQAF